MKFRNAISHTDDSRAQRSDSKKVRKTCHKAFVDRCHQLHDIARMHPGALKGLLLVVGKPLEILLRAAERDRIAQGPRGSDVIDHLVLRHAQEILIVELQILLLSERDLYQILYVTDC